MVRERRKEEGGRARMQELGDEMGGLEPVLRGWRGVKTIHRSPPPLKC